MQAKFTLASYVDHASNVSHDTVNRHLKKEKMTV
jgi:hypothetical protein